MHPKFRGLQQRVPFGEQHRQGKAGNVFISEEAAKTVLRVRRLATNREEFEEEEEEEDPSLAVAPVGFSTT